LSTLRTYTSFLWSQTIWEVVRGSRVRVGKVDLDESICPRARDSHVFYDGRDEQLETFDVSILADRVSHKNVSILNSKTYHQYLDF
jgi:hypothetical protein